MVEASLNYRQRLFASNAFSNVLKYFDMRELLEFRKVNPKMANEYVTRCFPEYRYECPEEEDEEEYQFLKNLKHCRKMVIKNVCGTEAHLRKIEEIGKN